MNLPAIACLLVISALVAPAADPTPIPCAHAHNDYEHARPLLDALDAGFCSVEADVWLVDGRLLVAHDRSRVRPERTLQALYLDPLRERVRKNGGRVYPGGPPVMLLIDFKSEAASTYRALQQALQPFAAMLTTYKPARTETGAVTVIISGNRPRELMAAEPMRLAAVDGRLADLEPGVSPHLMPLVSDNWTLHFRWRGNGPLPDEDRQKLRQAVQKAHARGQRLRLWGAPDNAAGWTELLEAGVDLVNTDDLEGFRRFWRERKR